jgi:hypothetical protein
MQAQSTLFDLPQAMPITDAPRCRMCMRPARWITSHAAFGPYCGTSGCINRERLCGACGQPFLIKVGVAGTKYCSTECKASGYDARSIVVRVRAICAWCGRQTDSKPYRREGEGVWPYLCSECADPLRHVRFRLIHHRVSHELARLLLANPTCQVCGVDILTPVAMRGDGPRRPRLVVDHDHNCCPGEKSCGQCVRGFLCTLCNSAAGMVLDDPATADALADYLRGGRSNFLGDSNRPDRLAPSALSPREFANG